MENRTNPDLLDIELVHRAKTGELSAFEALTTRYERLVYTLALRMLRDEQKAQDATQETFLNAIEQLGGLRDEAAFSTWLLGLATQAVLARVATCRFLEPPIRQSSVAARRDAAQPARQSSRSLRTGPEMRPSMATVRRSRLAESGLGD